MYIGLDIGGSWIKAIAWNGKKISGQTFRTPKGLKQFEQTILKVIQDVSGEGQVKGIGIGLAGMVTPEKAVRCHNLSFLNGYNITKFIKNKTGVPVRLDNDARCFLRGALGAGEAKGFHSVLGVTIGTGLGGALALNDKVLTGAHYTAGEIGHMIFNGRDLEDWASAAYYKKHPGAKTYHEIGKNLGLGLVSAVNLFDPELIIIGGGFMKDKKVAGIILSQAKKQLQEKLKKRPASVVKVKASSLGDFGGALGAALLFVK